MRLKEDKSSWKASGVIAKDARNTKGSDETKKPAAKKDTKKWCGGKVGRPHKAVWVDYNDILHQGVRDARGRIRGLDFCDSFVFQCTVCKKQLDTWWGKHKGETPPRIGSTEPRKAAANAAPKEGA